MRDATEIVVVLDKSGSMGSTKDDVVGGFNRFLDEQKKLPGECTMTMVFFDTTYEIKSACPVRDIQPLDDKTYRPGGMTALLDAVGKAVTETGNRLAALEETQRPDKVIVVVITDGQENFSREHTLQIVREMLEHQQSKYSWKFIFLGADIDSFGDAAKLGITQDFAVNFTKSKKGVDCLYRGISDAVSNYRINGELGNDWKAIVDSGNEPDKQ
jgi:uncharacterized protein YegL